MLNELQQQAANAGSGPQLVLAGPGTGKTTTLTARFAYLVEQGVAPARILAVTFTRKAGDELRERLAPLLGMATGSLNVGTFHSFGGKILRQYAELAGFTPRFRILDEGAQRGVIYGLKIFWNPENGQELTEIFASAKARMMDAEMFRKHVEAMLRERLIPANDPILEAVDHFHDYERALREMDACDFEDLIMHTVLLLEQNRRVCTEVAARFDHILVDEFQDVNEGQFRLLRALLDSHRNLWCVGDDDQSIYAFRGADAGYTLAFQKFFPDARLLRLSENYRSTEQVLTMAQALISLNQSRHEKHLTATRGEGPPVVIISHPNPEKEAAWMIEAVKKVLERGIPPRQVAILFRVGQQAFALQLAFQKAGIGHVIRGAGDYWQMAPVKQFRLMLRLAADPGDGAAKRQMGSGRRAEGFIQKALFVRNKPYAKQVTAVRNELSGNPPHFYGPQRAGDWSHRVFAAAEVAQELGGAAALEAWIAEQARAMRQGEQDAVTLSTIHGAKGLEWHTVFLAGFEVGMLPHPLNEDEQEERRLAYVALTRAKRYLCLSFCFARYDDATGISPHLESLLNKAPATLYVVRGELYDQGQIAVEAKLSGSIPKAAAGDSAVKMGQRWTRAEEEKLMGYRDRGLSVNDIAKKLKRSRNSITKRLKKLQDEWVSTHEPDEVDQWREALIGEAISFMDYDIALVWMKQSQANLGSISPWEACTTAAGYKKACGLLKKERLRREARG